MFTPYSKLSATIRAFFRPSIVGDDPSDHLDATISFLLTRAWYLSSFLLHGSAHAELYRGRRKGEAVGALTPLHWAEYFHHNHHNHEENGRKGHDHHSAARR